MFESRRRHHVCDGSVAQLDRATAFEAVGRGFESLRTRHKILDFMECYLIYLFSFVWHYKAVLLF